MPEKKASDTPQAHSHADGTDQGTLDIYAGCLEAYPPPFNAAGDGEDHEKGGKRRPSA